MRKSSHLPLLALAAVPLLAAQALAAPLSKTPGATLIFPYFEVDLDAPDGRSTLISVGNAGEPVVAHATIWSDRGVPVYAWDVYLGENALATYNLRDIVAYGNVAPTRAPASFGGCGDPVATPALSAADLALLQKQLTGQNLGNNNCASEPRPDITLATGSLTIDTVVDCRAGSGQRYPTDYGYFSSGNPRASSRKVLWGDFTLVDPAENFAQGYEAYALGIATNTDSFSRFGTWPANPGVAREAIGELGNCSRMRYLLGGPFDARTSFFVYTPPPQSVGDNLCFDETVNHSWVLRFFDEEGLERSAASVNSAYQTSRRIELGGDFPTYTPSGYVELSAYVLLRGGINPVPRSFPVEHLLLGAIQASGRFAVGTSGTEIDSCHASQP